MRLSPARYIRRNLRHSLGVSLAIAAVVACIATVLTGALLVGDSMRHSLRTLTWQRLGPVDSAIRHDLFFTPSQALSSLKNTRLWANAVPGIVLDASLTIDESSAIPVACGTTVVGVDDEFWNAWFTQNRKTDSLQTASNEGEENKKFTSPPSRDISQVAQTEPSSWNQNEIVVNQQLAQALAVGSNTASVTSSAADLVFIEPDAIPAENTFGRRDDIHARHRVRIRGVIENDLGPGSFSFASDQSTPPLAFVPLKQLQNFLDRPGQVNTIFLLNPVRQSSVSADMIAQAIAGKPVFSLEELGINFSQKLFPVRNTKDTQQSVSRKTNTLTCLYLGSSRFYFSDLLKNRITEILSPIQTNDCLVSPVCIYLANSIEKVENDKNKGTSQPQPSPQSGKSGSPARLSVPYSLIAGVEPKLIERFVLNGLKTPPNDAIWINQFLADQLRLVPGNRIRLTFFRPDDSSGLHRETNQSFTVAGIVPDVSPCDAHLVPSVHGLTDAATLADWNPTFPFDARRIAQQDEDYWEQHHTAPKVFIPLVQAEKLFGSRFGSVSSFCILAPQTDRSTLADTVQQTLISQLSLNDAGLPIIPFRSQALASSGGTTPFDVLFLCFSSFLIVSVLIMLVVLVRLSLDLKHRELGVLMTLGFSQSRISRLVLGELLVPLFWGTLIGTLLGGYYTRVMIYGLCHWWVGAIGNPFIRWHARPGSLVVGMAITFAASVLTVMFVLRRVRKMQPIDAVCRVTILSAPTSCNAQRSSRVIKTSVAYLLLLAAVVIVCFGTSVANMAPDMKAGLFFGSAAMVLAGLILFFDSRLTRQKRQNVYSSHTDERTSSTGLNLTRFAASNLARHPWRTMLTVTLLASSLFVVGATGIFRLDIPRTPAGKTPPLCVETRLPIFEDLTVEQGRDDLLTDPDDAKILAKTRFIPFRVRPGQRTGCSNLYRAGSRLRLVGVPDVFVTQLDEVTQKKYKQLNHETDSLTADSNKSSNDVIPILLDRNTAMYALQIYSPGATLQLQNDQGQIIYGQVVDFLDQSIFQSEVIMSETNMLKYFPEVAGWQFFYVEQLNQTNEESASALKRFEGAVARTFGDYGPTIETVPDRLGRFFRVQNGYITIFQTLGALGVLLGTLGLAGLQVQDLFARRREWALLQTIGFSRGRIFSILFLENAFMLFLAVFMGWLATVVAVWPQLQNQLLDGTLSWTVLVPSAFFMLPAVGILMIGLLSLVFVWTSSRKQTGFQFLLDS